MFCPLPRLEPRDSHLLWFTPHDERSRDASGPTSNNAPHGNRRSSNPLGYHSQNATSSNDHDHRSSFLALDSLSSIVLGERTLDARKNNIATFGATWIRPTGCSKTMLALREEEAEREEMEPSGMTGGADGDVMMTMADATQEATGAHVNDWNDDMMRNLDDDIPDASQNDLSEEGLVESGEQGFDDGMNEEEEGLMERDLDDDVPEGDLYSGEESEDHEEEEDEEQEGEREEGTEGVDEALENPDDNDENEEMRTDSVMLERNLDDDIPDGDESSVVYNPYTEDGFMDQGLATSLPGSNAPEPEPEPEREWANSDNEDFPQSTLNLDSNLSSFLGRDEQKYENGAEDTPTDADNYTQSLLQSSTSTLPPMMTPSLRAPRTNRRPIYPSRTFQRIMSPVGPIPFLQPSGHHDSETERLYSRRWSGAISASGIGSGSGDRFGSDSRNADAQVEPNREPQVNQTNEDSPTSPSLPNVNTRERRTQRSNQDLSGPRMRTRRQAALGR